VLLIIFMVTAPKPTTDLRVDLPRPGPSRPVTVPPTIIDVRVGPTGARLFIGSEEVSQAQLVEATLAHMQAADPSLSGEDALAGGRVFVRADLDVAYQDVVTVVDLLARAHFQKVAIAAQRADSN